VIGDVTVSGNTIRKNTNYEGEGGGLYVYIQGDSATSGGNIRLEKNIISGNTSYSDGRGVYVNISTDTGASGEVNLVENVISGNYAFDYGGGVFIESVCYSTGNLRTVKLTSNIIQENSVNESYGGIYVDSYSSSGAAADVRLVNNMIVKNKVSKGGTGGFYVSSGTESGTPGDITLTNNTIAENTAVSGPGGAKFYLKDNTLKVYNNIIWGNKASSTPADVSFYSNGNPITANGYSNLVSAVVETWTNSGDNIDADPLFVNAVGGDYHIHEISPCRNAGLAAAPEAPKKDFEGELRSRVDIGADEYPQASLSGIILLLFD